MIPIEKEPDDWYLSLRVYERCYFCNNPTDTWHNGTNQPVCEKCSKKHKVSELKKSHPEYKPVKKNKMTTPTLKTLVSLRTKLVKQLMSIPYDTTDKAEIEKMNGLIKYIKSVNSKISKTK
jgi:hypothetical protein